jgi:hypothetical protein
MKWFPGFKAFAFKLNLYRYNAGACSAASTGCSADGVGLYKLNAVQLTHSLYAPGFDHLSYQVKNLVSKFACKCQLVPLQRESVESRKPRPEVRRQQSDDALDGLAVL